MDIRPGSKTEKITAWLPDFLTVSRLLLTALFLWILADSLYKGLTRMPVALYILVALIFLSDFFDGRLARHFKAESSLGVILDVTADCLFIALSLLVFNLYGILPVWFTAVVIADFAGFLITSRLLANEKHRSLLVFDKIGRVAAVTFYWIPVLTCLALFSRTFISLVSALL